MRPHRQRLERRRPRNFITTLLSPRPLPSSPSAKRVGKTDTDSADMPDVVAELDAMGKK